LRHIGSDRLTWIATRGTPEVCRGEHWRENPGAAFPYYVLRIGAGLDLSDHIAWDVISFAALWTAAAVILGTASGIGLPVDASIGVSHTDRLEAALEKRKYRNALVLVAWEHNDIVTIARDLLSANGGDTTRVPDASPGDDFDSLFVVTITRIGKSTKASFERKHEGLDGQPIDCQ